MLGSKRRQVTKHLIDETLKNAAAKNEELEEAKNYFRERYLGFKKEAISHVEAQDDLLRLIDYILTLGQDAIDEAFLQFLQACAEMRTAPRGIIDDIRTTIHRELFIPFHGHIYMIIEDILKRDESLSQTSREQMLNRFDKMISGRLTKILNERCAEAKKQTYKGKPIKPTQSDFSRRMEVWAVPIVGTILATIIGGLMLLWIQR